MSHFIRNEVVHRIELGDFERAAGLELSGEWIDIKAGRSIADREAYEKASAALGRYVTTTGQLREGANLDGVALYETRDVLFQRSIVAWNLKDGDAIAPLSPESFHALSDPLSDWLSAEMLKYYDARRPTADAFLSLNGSSSGH